MKYVRIKPVLAISVVLFAGHLHAAGISPEVHDDARVTFRVKAGLGECLLPNLVPLGA